MAHMTSIWFLLNTQARCKPLVLMQISNKQILDGRVTKIEYGGSKLRLLSHSQSLGSIPDSPTF